MKILGKEFGSNKEKYQVEEKEKKGKGAETAGRTQLFVIPSSH